MNTNDSRKTFVEPTCEVIKFVSEDILTTSSDDWWIHEFEIELP